MNKAKILTCMRYFALYLKWPGSWLTISQNIFNCNREILQCIFEAMTDHVGAPYKTPPTDGSYYIYTTG